MNPKQPSLPERLTRCLRRTLWKVPVTSLLLAQFALWSLQVRGATLTWNADGVSGVPTGGTGDWDTTLTNWDNGGILQAWNNSNNDVALFDGTPGTVTLTTGITAGGLTFNTGGYVLTGSLLTLNAPIGSNSPVLHVAGPGQRATIESILTANGGFTKTGNGVVALTGGGNSLGGDISIKGGVVVVNDAGQFNSGTTAISVTGVAGTGNPGYSGGTLLLAGPGVGQGMDLSRDLSVSGRGPNAVNNSGALVSVGNNTISGGLTIGSGATESRVWATHGTTTVSGGVYLGAGGAQLFQGNGNWNITGQVSSSEVANDRLIKTGQVIGTTLWLQNANNNFISNVRIDSGTVRVSNVGALGLNTGPQSIELNGGSIEIRTDNAASFANRSLSLRASGSVFAGREIGGTGLNQTLTLKGLSFATNSNQTYTFTGRNGYAITVGTGGTATMISGNPTTINNTANNLLTLNSSFAMADGTGRVMALGGNGDWLVTGNFLSPSGGNHIWNKTGSGLMTINGTAGTMTGSFNIVGTVAVTGIGAFNSAGAGAIQLNTGALDYRGTGETSTKLINLLSTTGPGVILANQPSGGALIFNGKPIAAGGVGAKTFYLGGSSSAGIINQIGGVIANNTSNTSVAKIGGNTWLYSPDPATYSASVAVNSGAAASGTNTNVLTVASAAGIMVGQAVTGTNIPAGTVVTGINGTTLTLSNNITTAVAAATPLTFGATANFAGTLTVSGGTLQIRPSAASGNGSDVINNTSAVIFNVDSLNGNHWAGGTLEYQGSATAGTLTEQAGALTATAGHGTVRVVANGGLPTLNFASLARTAGGTLNLDPGADTAITFTAAAGANGLLGGYATFGPNGTDFAASVAAGGAATALTGQAQIPVSGGSATVNYQSTASPAGPLSAQSINSLKMAGPQTITLGGIQTITSGGILFDNSTGPALIEHNGTVTNTLGANNSEVIITTNGSTPGNALTVNARISSGTGSLTKAGSGTLIVGGVNVYTGTTTINAGTLQLGPTGTLGTNANLVMRQGTTLDLAGVSLVSGTASAVNSLNGPGLITNSAASGTATLQIGNSNGAGNFTGLIQDGATAAIALTKSGTGIQAMSQAHTYSGVTTISGGSLDVTTLANIGVASGLGKGDATSDATNAASLVFNGGNLRYVGTNSGGAVTATQSPSVSTDRLFTLAANGGIYSFGSFGHINQTRAANNATVIFSNTGDVVFSGAGARTLTLGGDSIGDNEMRLHLINNPNANETLSLTKVDGSLWIINPISSNTYTGTTTISGGALQVAPETDAIQGLPSTSPLVINGGVLQTSGTFTRSLAAPVAGTGSVQLPGGASGFAASTPAGLVVSLDAGAPLTWGGNFNPSSLVLGSSTALGTTEITNDINLGTAARTVTVNNNGNTGTMVTAGILKGVISGGVGGTLTKNGGGPLILGNANTYVGNTTITVGNLIVTSIGNASGTVSSSLGASGGTLIISNPSDADISPLFYVGSGEVASRPVTLTSTNQHTTTRTYRLDSSGSGPLVMNGTFANTIQANATGRTAVLELRGSNADLNQMNMVLTNSTGTNTPTLSVSKTDGGVWVLNPATANSFTGSITASAGLLGLTSNGIGTASSILLNNGGIFGYGGPLTIGVPVQGNNSTAVFAGSNAITINNSVTKTAGNNQWTISNNLEGGALLTINGNFVNAEAGGSAATQTISLRGYGSWLWNGVIGENAAAGGKTAWNIALHPDANFTMAGVSANAYSGTTTMTDGNLILAKTGALGSGIFAFNGGTLSTTFAGGLVGANAITNAVQFNASPPKFTGTESIQLSGVVTLGASRNVENSISGGQLILSGGITNSAASTLTIYGSGNTLISGNYNAGTGANGLTFSGTGSLALTGTNAATGALTVSRSTITMSGTAGGTWNAGTVTINPTGTLTLDNTGGDNAAGRLADAGAFAANGGTLNLIGDANGTAELTGALTVNTAQSYITMSGAGPNTLTFASAAFPSTGSSLDLSGVPDLGTTNQVKITAALPAGIVNNGVMPRAFIGGSDFATYDAAAGIRAFTAYNNSNNLTGAAATDTLNLTAGASIAAHKTINALKINGTGLTVSGGPSNVLTLSGAGLLNTSGDNSISVPALAFAGNTGFIQVASGTTLTLAGSLTGTNGFAKALNGTLQLNTPSFLTGVQNLLGGTLKLGAGLNSLFPNQQFVMNVGTTLDLNGSAQYLERLSSPGALPGMGGTIMTSTGTGTLLTNMGGSTVYAGQITGNINFARTNGNTLTLESAQTYTGQTLMMGGTLGLENEATILNSSAIDLNYATLSLNNNSGLQSANNNRIGDAIPITLRSGAIAFNGRISTAATETFGALTAASGANSITSSIGGGTFNSAEITFASLARLPGATVNFSGTTLGQQGNTSRIYFTAPLTSHAGGVLGGWAIANSTDYAAYNTGLGVGVVGQGGFAGYESSFASGNVTELAALGTLPVTTTLASGGATTGLLRIAGNFTNNVAFANGGDILHLELGGILRSNNLFDTTIGTLANRGVITAGTPELVIYNNANGNPTFGGAATTINSQTVTMTSTVGLRPGMTVTNGGLPAGTTIVSVDSLTQVTVSQQATATATGQTLTGGAFLNGVTVLNSAQVTMNSTTGLAPGMTFTGTGIPAGTYIVSVDSPTQVTLSQNATAAGSALTFTGGVSNLIVNSVIADNGSPLTLVKSGAGAMNLTANNTYTGGTIVSQGTVNLMGSGVVIPAGTGGITLTGASMIMNTNPGQIAAGNSVTLNGSSTLTMVGNNTLTNIVFNNNGGASNPGVNTGGILTLSNSTTPISVTSSNPLITPTIAGAGLNLGSGARTLDIPAIMVGGVQVTKIHPTLSITAPILSPGVALTKTGNGLLHVSGQSTFTGGLNFTAGGIIIGGNSTPTSGGNGLFSGPLGTSSVTAAAGTTFLVDGSRIVGNDIAFGGTPTFDATANTAWTLTLNGRLDGISDGIPTINVKNPFLTVALLGNIPNIASITSFNKTGLGTLIFNATGYTGDFNATALGNASAVSLLHDGNSPNVGNGVVETIALGDVIFDAGIVPTITVGRAGGSLPFNAAVNKIIEPASINSLGGGFTVNNNNGYGLSITDAVALTGTPTINVSTASISPATQGVYMSGEVSGTGFSKVGNGTLVLSNNLNSFTGNIDIQRGVVSVSTDAQLGNAANIVRLNPTSGTTPTSTFRATGDISTSRVIQLSNTANTRTIEVGVGNTLTLNSAFDLNAGAGATASLFKGDRGTLTLTASNSGWSGAWTINGGALRTGLAAALGTGAITVNNPGAALQLEGGITVPNAITINMGGDNAIVTGLLTGGAIQSLSGANVISTAVSVTGAPATDNTTRSFGIGADAGASLTLSGNLNINTPGGTGRNVIGYVGGAGDITLGGVLDNTNSTVGASFLFKYGNGTLTLTGGSAMPDTELRVYRGTTLLTGAGTLGTSGLQAQVWQNGTLTLDNTVTNTANRFGSNRVVQMGGGVLNVLPNAAGSSHVSTGALQISSGSNVINLGSGGNQTVTFASLTQNGGATLNMTGTFGTATNRLTFTTAPGLSPAGTGLLARITTNGNEFATYNATNGIMPFTGYAAASNILSAGATQTFKATDVTANSLTGNQTLNALTLSSGAGSTNVGGLSGLNPTTLTLTSGGILVNGTGTSSTLSVPVVALAGVEGIVHVATGQSLNVTSGISGTAGLTKALNGTLNFNAQQFYTGNTTVNSGTLNLTPGATNTLFFNNGLVINSGATVDLKNGVQFISGLSSANGGGSTDLGGGTITNSGAQATLVVNSNTSFNGQITGTIFLNKTGTGALNLQNPNTYTGATVINGGTFTLQDNGSLPNTTSIAISRANLTISNSNLAISGNRVNDTAPISLNGASISFNGRFQTDTSETLGVVTLIDGHNGIFPSLASTTQALTNAGYATNTLTLGGLTRAPGSTATLRFNSLGALGLIGNSNRVLVNGGMTLTNNIIGPWAIVDREYATYDTVYGVSALGQNGMAGYSGAGLNSNPLATDNVRHSTTGTTVLLANTVVNTLNISNATTNTVLDLGGNTLRLQGGGLLIGQNTDNITVTVNNGTITSGVVGTASDFYLIHAPFSATGRTASIGAAIADNAPGTGPVRLIVSAGDTRAASGGLTLAGANTYTGGTVLQHSTLTLGATATLGTGGITVNQAAFIQTAGGVIPAQALTMNGGSSMTLAGNNTFTGITFNSNGGGAPTLNPTGTLTLTGGITSTPTAAGAISTISNGSLNLNGNAAYSVNVAATLVNGQDVAPWQAGLIINSAIENGGIVKSGAGLLQLGGQGTFSGGVNVTEGGLIIGANSNPAGLGDVVTSGPLGTGTLTMAANTTMLASTAVTVSNNVVFQGDMTFNGLNNITLNGITTIPSVWNATVTAPQTTITIGDASPSLGTDIINKSGLGILVVGNYAGTIQATGGLVFTGDGNKLGTVENLNLGGDLTLTGDTAITVNRSGSAPNARNKFLQKEDLIIPGNIMSVSNQSGYGLEFTGTTTMTGPAHFAVGVATGSNVVQGLYLSGVVDDGAANFGIIKSGPGTLVLGDSANTFGGAGQTIDILNGILSVNSDGALGDAANSVTLNVDGAAGVGFRSTGTFSTGRTFNLNQANNAFEVTAGNILTLTAPFAFSSATNALAKNDNGIVQVTAANPTWNGAVTINAGAIRVANSAALGTGTVTINNATNSALQLTGGVNVANPINLVTNGGSGFNSGGILESFSGTNTLSGLITQTSGSAFVYGAAAGATLNINGNIATGNSATFNAAAGGVINLNSLYGNGGAGGPSIIKIGAGTLNVTVNQPAVTSAIAVNQGTLNVSGSGVGLGITGTITVNANGTLNVDDSVGAASAHLGGRPLTLQGGTFNYAGNAANSAETLGILSFAREGGTFITNANGAATSALTFASLTFAGDSSAKFVGTNLGTASNRILFTTAPTLVPATTGILARATVNGSTFATYNATTGVTGFTAYNATSATSLVAAAATDTVDVNAGLTTRNLTATKTINALRFSDPAGATVGGAAFNQLVLTAGGILATGAANHTLNVPVLANAAVQNLFHVNTGSTLTVTSAVTGTAGLVKEGPGTLTLTPANSGGVSVNTLTGNVTVANGILKLNGGTNTLLPGQFLIMGGPGATLDLNGNSQQISGLLTDTTHPGSGGTITSSTGTGQLVMAADTRTYAGTFTGSLNLVKSGSGNLTLVTATSQNGLTLVNGGALILQSDATLSNTTAIDINFATLSADNNLGLNDLTNRINDVAPITLRGGTLTVQGRSQTASSETVGTVSVVQGFNVINPLVGGTGVNSIDVSLASLSRPAGSSATLIVQGTNLGTIGSNSRVTVGMLNGVATSSLAYSANGGGLTNNIVGGWAENGNDFLTYIPGIGLAALNQAGAAQYDLNNSFIGGVGTDNVRLAATTIVPNGGSNVNAVSMAGAAINITFATATDTLNLTSGGLIGPNNNQLIGAALDSGRLTAGGLTPGASSDLYVFNRANTLTINSRIIDNPNGGGSAVRAVFTASGGAITLVNANNSYTGGTVLNGGTLNLSNTLGATVIPAGGLEINGGTVTMNTLAGQIASSNIVTLNNGILNYAGNNTQAGFVFNNIGGTGNPAVQSFATNTAFGAGSNGVLTIGSSGVYAASSNVGTTNIFLGRVDFGTTNNTITVDPIIVNGISVAPLNAALALQGIVNSTGGITKAGNGVLQFNAQSHYSGPTIVTAGSIRTGVTNGGSRLSALTLNSGTAFNIAGANTTWGSLAGSGKVFNSGGAATLTVGFDDTSTTFSGQLARFNDAVVNGVFLQKVGAGVMSMTSAQNFATGTTGTITVNGGAIRYVDAGEAFNGTALSGGGTFTLNNGGTLALDNTGTANVNSRLGLDVVGTLNVQGGTLTLNGSSTAATPTTEQITTFNVLNGGGRVELSADPANPLTLAITTLNTANGSGTLVVGGITGAASANGVARLTITTPNLIGGQGTGANGTSTMPVRHDILADASVNGLGTGFLVRDSVTNNYRALGTDSAGNAAPGELASSIPLPLAAGADDQNVGLSSAQLISANSIANTLTISGTASVSSGLDAAFGSYGPGGGLLSLTLSNAAASLTLGGATGNINVGAFGSTTAGTTPFVHVISGGTLNVNAAFAVNGTAGLAKADGGVLNLNKPAYYTGTTSINGGTLNLNSGAANTLAVVPTSGGATVGQVNINGTGAILDLKGSNQAIGALTSINPLPGHGGTVQNTGAAAVLSLNGTGTFAGTITGAIALTRAGNNVTTLTAANTYTGATIVRGGTLELRDSGALSSTAGLVLNYGTLNWNNFGLNPNGNPNPLRIPANNPVTLQGGVLTINGAGSTDTVVTLNSVAVTGGNNVVNTLPYINEGSTVKLTIGNLIRNTTNHSNVVFNGFTTNNSSGSNTLGGQGLTTNSNVFISQINGAAGPLQHTIVGAVTTAGSNIVTVPSTLGLVVGQPITGTGLPAGVTIAAITSPTTFTLNTGVGVTAQAATTLTSTNLVDNLIGGWAVADGSTFATYSNLFGVVAMGNTYGGFAAPGFTGTDISVATVATGNYNDGSSRTLTGAKVANSWRFAPGAAQTITFAAGATAALDVGIITNAGFATSLVATDATNTLSGTGTDLYFYINQNTVAIEPAITGGAALVSSGPATLSLRPRFASNTYTGGTFVQGGTLNLQATSPFIAIPGNLTITNAAVTMSTTPNQIAATSAVTINGGGTFTLPNYSTGPTQTLASFTFNNEGGAVAPTVSLGTPTVATSTLVLSATNAITATNNSLATTPVISTGAPTLTALQFSAANPVITVNAGLALTGLSISAPITQNAGMTGPLAKSGAGALALSGANTFTTGFNLDQGSLIFGANSTPTSGTVTSGPVGTGTLTLADGTSVLSDGTARTIANATVVNGNITFGGVIAGNGLTLSGAMNLGAADRTMTVSSPAVTATLSGIITSTATGTALTKAGNGTLVLSNAGNNFNGAGVAVTGGILRNGVNNAIPTTSALTVSAGAGYDLANFDQTLDGINGAGFITNSANATKTLTVGGTAGNSSFSGILTDNDTAQASSRLALTKVGTGTLSLTNAASDYSGVTTVSGGVLEVTTLVNGGLVSSIGNTSSAAANVVLNGGVLRYSGAAGSTDRNFTLGASGGGLESSGAGAFTFASTAAVTYAGTNTSPTFTLGGTNTGTNVFAGLLGNNGTGSTALVKNGPGTWTLPSAQSHAGGTTVSDGRLQINGLSGAGLVSVVKVGASQANAPVLMGSGTIAGATTIGSTSVSTDVGVLAPGIGNPNTSNQTLTFTSSLTVATGSQLQLSITNPTVVAEAGVVAALASGSYTNLAAYLADYFTANSSYPSWVNQAPAINAGVQDSDYISAGSLTLHQRISVLEDPATDGTVLVVDNGYINFAKGDIFNLIDWVGAMGGDFTTSNTPGNSGSFGDLDLPILPDGWGWDASAFTTHGVLVVVPEPSRMLMLFLGLGLLIFRRRR